MEWIESRLDDAFFESMLSPLVRQVLEKLLFDGAPGGAPPGAPDRVQEGFFVFHRELGLVLQNAASRPVFPKILQGAGWMELAALLERALVPASRQEFHERAFGDAPAFRGSWSLLPDRISRSSSLFLWAGRFDWGLAVFVKTDPEALSGQAIARFEEKAEGIEPRLRALLDRWMLDATLEVFWCRILGNIPDPFVPLEGSASPEWRRSMPIPNLSRTEGVGEAILVGDYWKVPGEGWSRRLLKPESRKKAAGSLPARTGAGEGGTSLEVPVDLWGIFDLGTVRFPAEIVRNFDVPDFLRKLRRARALSLRSLFRHLLYPGPLSFLSSWLPEEECFDLKVLGELPSLGPPSMMEDTLATLLLPSQGYRKKVEEMLRPADLLFQDPKKPGRIHLYLRGCPPDRAKTSVFTRLLKIEGMTDKSLLGAGSLREFLASQGVPMPNRKGTSP